MTRLIDLTYPIDPAFRDAVPTPELAMIVGPTVEWYTHTGAGRDMLMRYFGCGPEDLPGGEGSAGEMLNQFGTHCGTHVDAPWHSGSVSEGRPARTIDQIELSELLAPGMVLDVREWARPGEAIPVDALAAAIDATGRDIRPGDAVLIRTGQERFAISDPAYFDYPGMSGDGTRFLTGRGAKILGTDAIGWDRPIPAMVEAYRKTGDPSHIWDGHYAIRDKEAFIVQQMDNLAELPPTGFTVGFFPIKLIGTSAAPARVVAFVD
ncbi:cyclase family protein [Nocardia arthritidis]|uniref:Cyclase family protein n=1 Tax=Nocardia arthritidis TaxID=228602 RepID=A0A6G9YFK2_9NOCA|nr:cyclase family protein [Nocardia arthritidis]QIS11982.1 cyclase family protein [Nocardia arthritidis]